MSAAATALHRGGEGPPLVLLHGFTDSWRTWERVLPALERHHAVLAPTLPGHLGGPPLPDVVTDAVMADAVEAAMDAAGIGLAHVAGNSLGGFVALQLAARGRARTVVALAPAGGWAIDDPAPAALFDAQEAMLAEARAAAPYASAITATAAGRRRVLGSICERPEGVPRALAAHLIHGVAGAVGAPRLLELARRSAWPLDAERITCPVRVVWGAADRVLPWPAAAVRFRERLLPQADWVVLDGVGHCPQLDAPAETADLILGTTGA